MGPVLCEFKSIFYIQVAKPVSEVREEAEPTDPRLEMLKHSTSSKT